MAREIHDKFLDDELGHRGLVKLIAQAILQDREDMRKKCAEVARAKLPLTPSIEVMIRNQISEAIERMDLNT